MAKLHKPLLLQGHVDKKNYFEGWYFKQVSGDEKEMICFIPGISLTENDRHCFVQTFFVSKNNDQPHVKTDYFRYSLDQFISRDKPFQIQIGPNIFSEDRVSLYLRNEQTKITGSFTIGEMLPIEKGIYSPTIMGPLAYIPFLECNHGVISMDHLVNGSVKINQHSIDLTGGKGYLEKDWGTSFPKEYIWLQCNHFSDPETFLFFSVADIPFMKTSLEGFICNLVVHDREYRFATYNRSKLSIKEATSKKLKIILENRKARLTIEAHPTDFGALTAPSVGSMNHTVKEGFSDSVHIHLEDFKRDFTYSTDGKMAGVEIVGYGNDNHH